MDLKHLLSPIQKDQGAPQTKNRQEATDSRQGWAHAPNSGPPNPSQPHQNYPPGYPPYPQPPHQHQHQHQHQQHERFDQYHPHPYEGHPIHAMRPDRSTTRERYPEAFPDQYPERPEVPLLSVSASTPLPGEPQQPLQYFVPTHKPAPPSGTIVPPPTGLNLSSYSFLLMEKRDREREAVERANRGYLADALSDKKDSHRDDGYNYSPRMQSSGIPAYSGHPGSPHTHPSDRSYPPGSYDDYHRSHPSDRDTRYSHPHHGPYPYPPTHYGHSEPYPPAGHHYHSSSSANIGDPYSHHRPTQEYTDHHHSPQTQSQFQFSSHRAMSPSLLDKPRFANGNLSVFRQSAADDSDGNASVSSSGSHKRRRRPKQTGGEKKLPGSALSTAHQLTRRNSQGSDFGIPDYYDGDSSDENLDVRTGLQSLNLQKSAKTAAAAKKLRTKTERPFKIGELVESIKSDTNGTWFAGRVVDLEDDPHDHINPKSVLIHFEGFAPVHDEWVKPSQIRACSTGSSFLRYGPSGAELPETWISYKKFYHSDLGRIARRHTGVAYDRRMLLHKCQCNTNPEERHHPEQPERLLEILCQFQKNGMLSLVKWIQGREATIEELVAAHTETHVRNYCCTETENRTYAREHGLPFGSEDEDEEEEEEDEEDNEVKEHAKEPTKPTQGRGRPKRGARGSILVAAASTDAPSQGDGALKSPTIPGQPEDVEMTTSQDKEGMEVDLHSPALGRRRSSMRGSVVRMSSLVSMSSTLYAQREEDMAPEDKALIVDDDDDDDDKMGQVGPAPSEAAAAVAGGMDPAVASQLTSSPKTVPKTVEPKDIKDAEMVKSEALEEDKNIPPLDLAKSEQDTKPEPKVENNSSTSLSGSTSSRRESGISKANVIEGQRRSSRSLQGQSGATAVIVPLPKTKEVNEEDDEPEPAVAGKEKKDKKDKDKEKEKEKEKDKAIVAKAKEHEVVSPAPLPTDDSRIIRPPGLTFTMTCSQLGIAVDTTWNPVHSSTAARVAAGCLITLVDQVVTGRCKNGFAIIRPPGHHAEEDEAMGFCFFNNVGVAVNLTLSRYPLTVQKILIIDWDVHHGNGTQQIFYENPNVLYISLHRWDNGHFYPFTGAPDECGEEAGEGKNVNIAWSSYGRGQAMGDVEYIAAFWYVLLPIARQFQPDLVFVSAGFDAADGHAANIGGYTVSPQGFAILTRLVQTLAGGRVILSLEGGYEFEPLANSATACLEELLPHSLLPATAPTRAFPFASFSGTLNSVKPNAMAVSSLHQVLKYQQKYWKFPPEVLNPSFRFQLPAEWKASNSLATRPRRERNPRRKAPALDS